MITKQISEDIISYLQKEKKMSAMQIAESFGDSTSNILKIINQQEIVSPEHLYNYLEKTKMKFFEFIKEAIPLDHLPPKIAEKVELCAELSEKIKRKE